MPYTFADLPFFLMLPVLLAGSAFFSGSETALFSLRAHQRFVITQQGGLVGRAVSMLLADPRTLLITLMLGNMVVNVLYFVVSTVLLLKLDHAEVGPLFVAFATVLPLLLVILLGEVLPKIVANTGAIVWVKASAIPLYAIHRVVLPLGALLSRWVVQPLGRLFAPPQSPGQLTTDEMDALLEMSQKRGIIGSGEQQLLNEVLYLSEIKVRDVMIPRVDISEIDVNEPPRRLRELIEKTRLTKYVAVDGGIDHVLGVIYARQFLLAHRLSPKVSLRKLVRQVRFVPELQRVDQLLEDFRKSGTKLALAVDEYGGTAGLVTLKDIVEQMVGDLDMDHGPGETPASTAEQLGPHRWRVSGRLSVHDWSDAFGQYRLPPRVSTVGGLVMSLLGRVPRLGDTVRVANLQLEVERMSGGRVESVLLHLDGGAGKP
ncbi:MAG: DUF21 domain-containing protein [Planctomycetes bacterium]|nr:DUF21 domain-containing protein [Planctomycetota bacterium]